MTGPRLSVIPARAATDRSLKPRDLQVLCVLGRHTDDLGWCRRSQVRMAEEMGCARSTVFEAVERLVAAGYLERHVQESDNGRDSAHVFRVVLDPKHPDVSSVPEFQEAVSGDAANGETGAHPPCRYIGTPAGISAPPAGPGPAPINDPSLTVERERARQENRQEAVSIAKSEAEKPEGLTKRAEALFWRAFKAWDRFDTSPKQPMLAAWGKLSWAQMEAAADAVPRFLAACRANGVKHAPAISTYLDPAERLWEGFPPVPERPADIGAPVFGPLWSAVRFRALVIDPPSTERPRPSAFMAGLLARDDAEGASARRGQQALYGWPGVNAMHISAENRRGIRIAAGSPLLALAGLMEAVPVDSAVWEAWRDEHERRGWPWLPDPGAMRVVWFPAGGPAGLAAFEAAVRGQCEDKDHDGGGRQAAE